MHSSKKTGDSYNKSSSDVQYNYILNSFVQLFAFGWNN